VLDIDSDTAAAFGAVDEANLPGLNQYFNAPSGKDDQ
jgi:putative methionine-R-sulfoxide reductase with GAF domain